MDNSKDQELGCFIVDNKKTVLDALLANNLIKFNSILNTEDIEIDEFYGHPHKGTLLDICCRQEGKCEFISSLLHHGANPNLINDFRKQGPIHFITQLADENGLRAILECENTDVNLIDNTGSTGLHYAVKRDSETMVAMILKRTDVDVNVINRRGKTPLHIALENENKRIVQQLLNEKTIDVSITDYDDTSLRTLIIELYPDLEDSLPNNTKSSLIGVATKSQLFTHLKKREFEQFARSIKGQKDILDMNDGTNTLLQHCCEYGLEEGVRLLIAEGVNPNTTHPANKQTGIMIAAFKGFVKIVEMLINNENTSYHPVKNETALHALSFGMEMGRGLSDDMNAERDHLICLKLLLNGPVALGKLNINQKDDHGNTVLHYAAKQNQLMALELLDAGAYIGEYNKAGEPACADISLKIMEQHLNKSIYTNDKPPRLDTYEIIFNYGCLIPSNCCSIELPATAYYDDHVEIKVGTDNGGTREESNFCCESQPLMYLSNSNELRTILKHPIFTSYLHLKWHKIRPWYYINLVFYSLFWALLTAYLLTVYSKGDNPMSANSSSTETLPSSTAEEERCKGCFLKVPLTLFLILLSLRELFQFIISPLKYVLNPENWLEAGIIILTITVLTSKYDEAVSHQLSAAGILFSWAELVLLVGRHPILSTNIEMLKTVSWNFLKFLAWYSILIVAFALSFYSLFKDDTEQEDLFKNPGTSVFKTVIMLTGEFDSSSIPFSHYPITGRILFVLFVFLIAIVLFNLLNGLAVSDTQAIKSDAELLGYISHVKLIAYVEKLLSNPVRCLNAISNIQKLFGSQSEIRKPPNTLFSDKINLFHKIPDKKIRILPNSNNRVELSIASSNKKRISENTDCFNSCKNIYMDSRIVRSAREILNNQLLEKEKEKELQERQEKEDNINRMIQEMSQALNELKQLYNNKPQLMQFQPFA